MTAEQNPYFEGLREEGSSSGTARPHREAPEPPERTSILLLIQTAISEAQKLLTAQIELLKIKAKAAASKAGIAIGLFLAALTLVFYFIWWTFHTIEVALTYAVPSWAASLITWALLLIAIAVLALVGMKMLNKASEEAPSSEDILIADIFAIDEGADE